ncbi:uroporphyrinogen-III synthase [uncultured Tolumonas sp.]|uniref:uroporphyrinogen-III synthase n=1 Tax=uncultured Tolumonas sp. TaxID=263765 RepID=UPI002A0A4BA5|nr:uroporphyrinogen-III synthase [uncultured Tolumonas sp.]
MTPLILRPQPAADELAALLRQQGHTPVVCPLLSYLPGSELGALTSRLSQADIVIAISVAAVQYASEQLVQQQTSWPSHCIYLAVGATTAAQWQQQGVQVISPTDARSEGLLALPVLQSATGKNILILRGNGGRELLADVLRELGAHVSYLECYRRHYLHTDGAPLLQEWQAAGVDSVIISSSKLFRQLIRLLPETASDWLSSQLWFVPSQRTADEIHQAGFNRVTIMSGVQHEAVVAALQNNPEDITHE